MRWLAFALLVMGLSACATSSLTLSPAEMAGIRIDEIRITFKEEATVWWGKAEEDYVAEVNAKAPAKSSPVKTVRFSPDGTLDKSGADDYSKLTSTPEAKAYLRKRVADLVRKRLETAVVPKFASGSRSVRLEIEVFHFTIPSAIQRVTLGGTPMLLAITRLTDAKTGAELGKLDRGAGAMAGQGALGVLVDQAFDELENRLADSYSNNVLTWLQAKS